MAKNKKVVLNTSKRDLPKIYKIAAVLIIVIAALYFIFLFSGKVQRIMMRNICSERMEN